MAKTKEKMPAAVAPEQKPSFETGQSRAAMEVKFFLRRQAEDWHRVELAQVQAADTIIEREIKKMQDEANLVQARTALN